MVNQTLFNNVSYVTLSDYEKLEEDAKFHKDACAKIVRAVNETFQSYALAEQKKKTLSALEQLQALDALINSKRIEWVTGAYSFSDPKDINSPMEWVNEFFRVQLNLKNEDAKHAIKKYTERIINALMAVQYTKIDKLEAERRRLREKSQVLISAMKLLLNGAIDDEL